jgi:hypothetical protein
MLNQAPSEQPTDIEEYVAGLTARLARMLDPDDPQRAECQLELAQNLVALERGPESWPLAREAFDTLIAHEEFELAAHTAHALFASGEPDALVALGHGIWLAVTFPVDVSLTVSLLTDVIEETPPDADGAAVAAGVAQYIVDLRAQGRQLDDLRFITGKALAEVAFRHSGVTSPDQFKGWVERLELNDPETMLRRLRAIVDVLVEQHWWFDVNEMRTRVPSN